jgi:heme/copper-type cytochrome/quinol oxidase subunit 2
MPTSSWVGLGVSLAIFATVELLLRKSLGRYAYKRGAQLGVRRLVKTEQWWTRFTLVPVVVIYYVAVVCLGMGIVQASAR